MAIKKTVPTKVLMGTISEISKDAFEVIGNNFYLYRVKDQCKRDLEKYNAKLGMVVILVYVKETDTVLMAVPEELGIGSLEIPETVEVTIKV